MMSRPVHRYASAAVGIAVAAAAVAVAPSAHPPAESAAPWVPSSFGMQAAPDDLLPVQISETHPVDVVSTVLDGSGRPVVTSRRATDRAAAQGLVLDAQRAPDAIGVELDAPTRLTAVTGGDTHRSLQWDIAKLDMTTAWATSTGAGATVAVLDSGVEAGHPDLAGRVLPGIDLISDTEGVSADPHGHGTHVAGTVAAVAGNELGVAGFAPGAMILPIRVLDATGSGVTSDVATGLVAAADRGADVANLSLGSAVQSGSVTNAIAYARSKGVVVVASAGNNRSTGSPTSWPAADAGVIAVAATDSADSYAPFSNQGDYVDVAAPGASILSTVPAAKGDYGYKSGTSMAAPHVAALAAQLIAIDPQLTPDAVQQAIETTAVDLGVTGKDADYGYGRIRPVQAVLTVTAPSAPATATPTSAPVTSSPVISSPVPSSPVTSVPVTSAPASTPPADPAPSVTSVPTSTATATPTATVPAAPPTTPAPTPRSPRGPVAKPVVTSTAKSRPVDYGSTVTTDFVVTASKQPWAGRTVSVCVSVAGGPFGCLPATTSAQGVVRHVRFAAATYRVKVQVAAAAGVSAAASSAAYTYTARAAAALTAAASDTLTAQITGAVGQVVRVQRQQRRAWVTVLTYAAVPSQSLGVSPGYRYRLLVAATPSLAGAQSDIVTL